jgi:carbon storage regulator
MLVLTRKPQEKIRIGDDIIITVLRMKGKSVRLGIEAPGNVQVLRGELVFEAAEEPDESAEENGGTTVLCARQLQQDPVSNWPADSHPAAPSDRDQQRCDVDVGHARVPRENRGQAIAQLIQSERPLRLLLDRRALSH